MPQGYAETQSTVAKKSKGGYGGFFWMGGVYIIEPMLS
ncbi:hypothetical protein ES703_57473 [subsurface metagenome]